MKKLFLLISSILIAIPSYARVCVSPSACGNTVGCDGQSMKFASWAAFNTWKSANKYTVYEIVYSSANYPIIMIYLDDCNYTESCWDKNGVCTK